MISTQKQETNKCLDKSKINQ